MQHTCSLDKYTILNPSSHECRELLIWYNTNAPPHKTRPPSSPLSPPPTIHELIHRQLGLNDGWQFSFPLLQVTFSYWRHCREALSSTLKDLSRIPLFLFWLPAVKAPLHGYQQKNDGILSHGWSIDCAY